MPGNSRILPSKAVPENNKLQREFNDLQNPNLEANTKPSWCSEFWRVNQGGVPDHVGRLEKN